ncbi:asparagine synthase (glutamine-hydrolyzing) [bacterium]|nr:asparagine synthase (glutamine-hydrolyzing) [bacterium]
MCGISGIVGRPDRQAVQRMMNAMKHRGPDDRGIYSDSVSALGMTRLAVLDLSPAAHQPMSTPDGRFIIVYNGEIYNYREERRILERKGHLFHSTCDTEVVLRLFQEYGQECVGRLRGMFAFAVWDRHEKCLFAARDRLGIKPFVYSVQNGNLIFASELKALLSSRRVPFIISEKGLNQYLFWGSVQPPETILSGVKTLLPGHCFWFKEGKISEYQYWDLCGSDHQQDPCRCYDECRERLLYELSESVRLELVSDVPLGVFLSGGLDSASIVALMKRSGTAHIHTYSIGFEDNRQMPDETKEAKQTAIHFGTEHQSLVVTGSEVARKFDDFVLTLDQPSVDGLNTFFISEFARSGVTVALSGLGGDELFAGYSRSWQMYWRRQGQSREGDQKFLNLFRSDFGKLFVHFLPDTVKSRLSDRMALGNVLTEYALRRRIFQPEQITRLLKPRFRPDRVSMNSASADIAYFDDPSLMDTVRRVSRLDLKTFMPFQLLRDMDAVSMGHSLEVRFPLIDHRMIEFSFRIPSSFKYAPSGKPAKISESSMNYATSGAKKILLEALRRDLPPNFEHRKKSGFKLPVEDWLRNDLSHQLKDHIFNPAVGARLFFRGKSLQSLYHGFLQGKVPYTHLWSIFVLLAWYQQMLRLIDRP